MSGAGSRSLLVPGVLALGICLGACGRGERTSADVQGKNASLGGEVAARVGDRAVPLSVVESVARAQRVSSREAARKVVEDEIAAAGARSRGLDRGKPASWRLVAARARFTSDRALEDAKRRGPPTDDEVNVLSEQHWAEVDRPPSVRVIHAITLRPKDAALVERARSIGSELHAAVVSAVDANDFEKRATAVLHDEKIVIRVERLPAFTEDGWVTEGGGRMDEVFTRAAFALPGPGATSAVIETSFGWHVIRLVERLPEMRMPIDARRIAFTEEVYSRRAREALEAQLKALRAANEVMIAPGAEQLMRSVTVASTEAVKSP